MRPIPVVFHIGALQVHTYGIGLAITFYIGYRYFAKRLGDHGYPSAWLSGTFLWIILAAIAGARAVHVIANFGYYHLHPLETLAVWHGGLSSFGGLALGIPVGLASARRRCPQLRALIAVDLVAPVLVLCWAIGRLLGPQLMVAGGGKPTSSFLGMYYAGEVGKRLPVPVFQAIECLAIYVVVLYVERHVLDRRAGIVVSVAVGLWGLSRFFDEYFWLTHDNGTDAVEIVSLCMFGVGVAIATYLVSRPRRTAPVRSEQGELVEQRL